MKHLFAKYVKRQGELVPNSRSQAQQLEAFIASIPENMMVEVFYEITHDDGTLPQLAKLHVLIKQLAMHTGITVDDMKVLIKDKAGLCIIREVAGKEYFLAKSFGECSKEELSLAIQACIELGEEVNLLVQ